MFRDVIKGTLERRETTYKKLEYQTEIDRTFINRVINGKKAIPLDPEWIAKICRAVELNPEDFPEYRERVALVYFWEHKEVRDQLFHEAKKKGSQKHAQGSRSLAG